MSENLVPREENRRACRSQHCKNTMDRGNTAKYCPSCEGLRTLVRKNPIVMFDILSAHMEEVTSAFDEVAKAIRKGSSE